MGECCYLQVTAGQGEVTSPRIQHGRSISACSPGASSASAALSSLCTNDILPRSFADSLGGQRSAQLVGSLVSHCLAKAFGGGGGLEGGEGGGGRRDPRPSPGQRRPRRAQFQSPVSTPSEGIPGAVTPRALLQRQV